MCVVDEIDVALSIGHTVAPRDERHAAHTALGVGGDGGVDRSRGCDARVVVPAAAHIRGARAVEGEPSANDREGRTPLMVALQRRDRAQRW